MKHSKNIWSKNFILLMVANFLCFITYYVIIATLPVYFIQNGADHATVGIVLAIFLFASILGRPFSGFILDKYHHKKVFLIALIVYAVFFLGYLTTFSVAIFIFIRFGQGLCYSFFTLSGATIAASILPKHNLGEGLGYFTLSTTLGMATGPALGGIILHNNGYNTIIWGMVIVTCIAILFVSLLHLPKNHSAVSKKLHIENMFEKKVILPSLNLAIIILPYGGLLSFLVLYGHKIQIKNPSFFFLFFAVGIALSRIIVGKIFDRKGPRLILSICLLLSAVGYLLLALLQNAIGFFSSAIILGFGTGVMFPIFTAMVNHLITHHNRRGAANSTLYFALDTGLALGMLTIGFIAQYLPLPVPFIFCAIMCLVGFFFFQKYVMASYTKALKDQ